MPAGFTLDTTLTNTLNGFGDGTTIVQAAAGADIIITVPAGQGTQNGLNSNAAYKIAGSYDVTQTASDQTLTASGPATMTQIVNAAGDTLDVTGSGVMTETLQGTGTTAADAATAVTNVGNSTSAPSQILLDTDTSNDAKYLEQYGFTTDSATATTDATITISIPDGFDATSVTLPASNTTTGGRYLYGTTSYTYQLTLADGTIENGVVAAGGTITTTDASAIRTIVLQPDSLAAGARTGGSPITVAGTLSSTYDNGTAVAGGDLLTSTITITGTGLTRPRKTIRKLSSHRQIR